MKGVVLDGYTLNLNDLDWKHLEAVDGLDELIVYDRTAPEDIISRIGDAEAVFINKIKMTDEVYDACPRLRFVGELATGYDNANVLSAKAHGVAVCNVPSYAMIPVAQHTMALILEITNNVGHYTEAVARLAEAFGMKVNVYSRDPDAVMDSDIITLHCPVTPENKGSVNKEFFAKMKDGAILINTARGALVNEEDLAEALSTGKLRAAAIDVVNGEPQSPDSPLIGVPNLYITPHLAWSDREARQQIIDVTADNLRSFLEGGDLNRVV